MQQDCLCCLEMQQIYQMKSAGAIGWACQCSGIPTVTCYADCDLSGLSFLALAYRAGNYILGALAGFSGGLMLRDSYDVKSVLKSCTSSQVD